MTFFTCQKIMKILVKLCLHSSYTVQNSFLFDEIFFTENSKLVDLSFFVYFRSPTSVIWIIQSKQGISLFTLEFEPNTK